MSINGLLIFGENSNRPIRVKNIISLIFPTTPKEGMVILPTLLEIGTFGRVGEPSISISAEPPVENLGN